MSRRAVKQANDVLKAEKETLLRQLEDAKAALHRVAQITNEALKAEREELMRQIVEPKAVEEVRELADSHCVTNAINDADLAEKEKLIGHLLDAKEARVLAEERRAANITDHDELMMQLAEARAAGEFRRACMAAS